MRPSVYRLAPHGPLPVTDSRNNIHRIQTWLNTNGVHVSFINVNSLFGIVNGHWGKTKLLLLLYSVLKELLGNVIRKTEKIVRAAFSIATTSTFWLIYFTESLWVIIKIYELF